MSDRTAQVDLDALLAIALAAATAAGELLVSRRPADLGVVHTKSSPTDVVTVMDTAAERLVTELLMAARPDDGVLGEEGADTPGTTGVRWVVDPVDGTVNYLYGLPGWAVSVAAELDGESVAGVVHSPTLGETYRAVRGGGSFVDTAGATRRLRVAPDVALDRALVATGFSYLASVRAEQADVLRTLLPRVRDVRRMGSAAVDVCHVASGQVDAYYERGVQRWDVAAARLVLSEAGGTLTGLRGAAASPEFVLGAGPGLLGPLHDLLADLHPATG